MQKHSAGISEQDLNDSTLCLFEMRSPNEGFFLFLKDLTRPPLFSADPLSQSRAQKLLNHMCWCKRGCPPLFRLCESSAQFFSLSRPRARAKSVSTAARKYFVYEKSGLICSYFAFWPWCLHKVAVEQCPCGDAVQSLLEQRANDCLHSYLTTPYQEQGTEQQAMHYTEKLQQHENHLSTVVLNQVIVPSPILVQFYPITVPRMCLAERRICINYVFFSSVPNCIVQKCLPASLHA